MGDPSVNIVRLTLDLIWSAIVDLPYAALFFFSAAVLFCIIGIIVAKSSPQETFLSNIPQFNHAKIALVLSLLSFLLWVLVGETGFQQWAENHLKYDAKVNPSPPSFNLNFFKSDKDDRLIGKWRKQAAAGEEPQFMRFYADGLLVYIFNTKGKNQLIFLNWKTDDGVIVTDQPSHPKEERTRYEFLLDNRLKMTHAQEGVSYWAAVDPTEDPDWRTYMKNN